MKDALAAALRWVDHFQRRHPIVALPVAVVKRFGEHDGGRLATAVSYYCFFSVFPLLLVFVTALGFVVRGDDDLRRDLLDGALGQIPVIGSQLAEAGQLPGSGAVLAFGIVAALWAGLGAVAAMQQALDVIFDIPVHERPNFLLQRLRSAAFLVVFGLGLAASTVLANVATVFDVGWIAGAAGLLATTAVNALLLVIMFTVLPAQRRPLRTLVPGAVGGAVLLVALQHLGSFVVRRYIAGASDTYGTFAIVIALLSWFHLVGRIVLMSAQLDTVLADGLTPRRLRSDGVATDADRRATLLDVRRIQRDPKLGYALAVDGHVATDQDPEGADDVSRPASGSADDVEVRGEAADLEEPLDRRAR